MSLISSSAGGSPPGKSISGLSMLTCMLLVLLRATRTVLQNGEDVQGEDQGGVGGDAALRLAAVGQVRRRHQHHAAADLLAGQALLPALDELRQREGGQLAALVAGVELLAAVPEHALVLQQQGVGGL